MIPGHVHPEDVPSSVEDEARDHLETQQMEFFEEVFADDEEESCEHDWQFTGTAYGGDDGSYHGEGRAYCVKCGRDGDS